MRLVRLFIVLGMVGLVPLGFAADPTPGLGDLDPNFRAWFGSPVALSVSVAVFTGYIKTLLKLDGNAVRILGLVVGIALAGVGAAVGELERNIVTVVLFGASAAVAAGGGWDIISGLIAIVAKVFGVVIPSGSLSQEPVNVRGSHVVVIEKESSPGSTVNVDVTHTKTETGKDGEV